MHSPTARASFVHPHPQGACAHTQERCRRRGERQVTKYSRKRRPRPRCCSSWKTTSTICRCTQGIGSPRRCCRSKPPPWAARPPRPGLPAAPERGLRAPPGPEDGSDAPVTCAEGLLGAQGLLDTGGRRSRLRSATATATPRVRHACDNAVSIFVNSITMRKRAVAQEYTASAQRSAERLQSERSAEHTAVATATTDRHRCDKLQRRARGAHTAVATASTGRAHGGLQRVQTTASTSAHSVLQIQRIQEQGSPAARDGRAPGICCTTSPRPRGTQQPSRAQLHALGAWTAL